MKKNGGSLLAVFAMTCGCIGLVACAVSVFGVWRIKTTLDRVSEQGFAQVDDSLANVRDRVVDTEQRVRAAKVAVEDVEQSLKNWTKREATDRIATRLDVEHKAERLAAGLQQVDRGLEISQSSLQVVRQALELGASSGAPLDTGPIERLLEELESLRAELTDAAETVERICARTAEAGEEKLFEIDMDQAARLVLRAMATVSSVDSRLGGFANRIVEVQTRVIEANSRSRRWLRIATILIVLLILWMAAGQYALCLYGWRRLRGRELP